MRKAVRFLVVSLMALVAILLIAIPSVVPPVVEYLIDMKIAELGLFPQAHMSLGYCWRNGPGLEGRLDVSLVDTPWKIVAEFGGSCCEWFARVRMPETSFSESDQTIQLLLKRFSPANVSNLTFSGSISMEAQAERTFSLPVPAWRVKVPIKNLSASCVANGRDVAVEDFTVTAGASGLARHVDIAPMFLRTKNFRFGEIDMPGCRASIRATERALIVTEATAGFCGGKLNVYSLFLDPQSLNTGFTLFLDDVDAGEALSKLRGFKGKASGKLHGKIKLFVRKGGQSVRLSDAFLYSTPGEGGKLQMENPEVVTDNLAMAGLDEAARANVAKALTDLDYSVLKLNLKRGEEDLATLTAHVDGTATRGSRTVPVNLTVNFHGELEQMLNLGLGYSALMKGKKK